MSFVNNNKPIYFSAKLRFAFFWKLHDVFEKFVDEENVFGICDEFEVIWECFGNGDEFNQHEFINVKLNVFGAFGICVIPLPYSRRDKCKKTNIAQCMLHEQQTYFALVVSCVEKSWATGAVRAVVLGFCVFV